MFHWRAALGRAVWRAAFGHVGSACRYYMIGGVFGVVKGGFWGIRRRMQDGGIPAYAGMTQARAGRTEGGSSCSAAAFFRKRGE